MKFILSRINRWKALIFLNAVYLVAGMAWIILIPYNNAPDENTHFHYSVEFILQNHRLPVWGVDDLDRFRHALSSYNQMPALNYVLYAAGAAGFHALFGLETYLGARLVSLLWGLVFLNFLFLAVKEICGNAKNALIITAAFAFIPQILFSFCYVNSDAHSLAIAAILGYALARFLNVQSLRRRGGPSALLRTGDAAALPASGPAVAFPIDISTIFLAAAIGLLFSAKYNYYIYFPCLAVVLLWAVLRGGVSWKAIGKLIIASAVLSAAISGFWFIRNYLLYGNPLPILMSEEFFKTIALAREVHPVNHGLSISSLAWLVKQGFISSTFDSFFAVFGYLNVGFHRWVYIILEFAVPILALLFIVVLPKSRDKLAIQALIALLVMTGCIMAMHVWACLTFDYQAQGRYNFTIIMPIALFAGWSVTRMPSLEKYAVIFMIMMVGLFIGANVLLIRTYGPPVQFYIFQTDKDGSPERLEPLTATARRTEKNYYATATLPLNTKTADGLRIGLASATGGLARYRDLKIELETDKGAIVSDWNTTPPEQMVNATYDNKLDAFEVHGKDAGFILPLTGNASKVRGIKITCRIENRRLYNP